MSELADFPTATERLSSAPERARPVLDARAVSHRYGEAFVLHDVALAVSAGEIHALLGPNGAGKTTLIRIVAGLLHPSSGSVQVAGFSAASGGRFFRQRIGFVPSGDRTFYLRLSALENLMFFARLHGMRRRGATHRALAVLAEVGLEEAARKRVGEYSHGMQKRLSVARALLTSPPVLLIDEATHDLDPEGARRIRALVAGEASRGAAVAWVTQRLDEIRGFADAVTVLGDGHVRFSGTVPQLMAHAAPRRFLVHLAGIGPDAALDSLNASLAPSAALMRIGDESARHYVLTLAEGAVLGHAVAALAAAGVKVLSCREERSEIEEAFLSLVDGSGG